MVQGCRGGSCSPDRRLRPHCRCPGSPVTSSVSGSPQWPYPVRGCRSGSERSSTSWKTLIGNPHLTGASFCASKDPGESSWLTACGAFTNFLPHRSGCGVGSLLLWGLARLVSEDRELRLKSLDLLHHILVRVRRGELQIVECQTA